MATRRQQKASATLTTAMTTVATETHSDARWWPLTWGEAGECSWKGRLGRGIWGIIWRLTKPLASWGGGQEMERERGRGTEERGGGRESTLFFLPSSERVAIDTAHLIKICATTAPSSSSSTRSPPLPPSGAQGPGSCLSRSGHSSSSAVHCRVKRKKADREKVGSRGGGE